MSYFGKYDILSEIGKGGFSTVYRARDVDLDRTVAIKILDPFLCEIRRQRKDFARKAGYWPS